MSPPRINVSELHVGSAVYARNGEKVGKLRFMVVDPESASVSHLVLEKGMMLHHDVLTPVSSVGQVLHRGIFLNLSPDEIRELPDFNESRYLQRERGEGGGGQGGGGNRDRDRDRDGGGGGGRRSKGRYRRHRERDHRD
ncbi:MAG: PRC-barrel domain-containing protein [Armatimonadetes bacterium]|nr:PRC-barrel domain-containing protein [Armatimonadota bacterium]